MLGATTTTEPTGLTFRKTADGGRHAASIGRTSAATTAFRPRRSIMPPPAEEEPGCTSFAGTSSWTALGSSWPGPSTCTATPGCERAAPHSCCRAVSTLLAFLCASLFCFRGVWPVAVPSDCFVLCASSTSMFSCFPLLLPLVAWLARKQGIGCA